jgi:hypothetical protein
MARKQKSKKTKTPKADAPMAQKQANKTEKG